MRNIIKSFFLGFSALLFTGLILQSCGSDANKKAEMKQKYIIPDSLLKTLVIDTVQTCPFINSITLNGQVDFNQDNVAKIYPMISGNIQDVKMVLGDYVTKGQSLGTIKSSEMAGYSNDLTNAQTNLEVATKNLDATKEMAKSGLSSQLDVAASQAAYTQAQSSLDRVGRVLKINGGNTQGEFVIKAPISGFIVEKFVTNNMTIRPDNATGLFTISDLKNVWIWANVYESNISSVHMGDDVDISTLSYPGKIFKGKVDKILNVLDPTNKVMKVRIVLQNSDYALKPQMFASVIVTNKVDKEAICISSKDVVFDHSQNYVLVYKSKSDVQVRPVNVINTVGNKTYLLDGVQPGETIIGSQAILMYDAINN